MSNFSKKIEIKKELDSLADKLYLIGEVEMTKDVFRVIASINFDELDGQKKDEKLVTSYKDIDDKSKILSNLFK